MNAHILRTKQSLQKMYESGGRRLGWWTIGSNLIGACTVSVSEEVLVGGAGVVNGCGSSGDVQELYFQFTN